MVSFKKIDICLIYGPKSIIFNSYAQIWVNGILLITKPILFNFDKTLYMRSGDGFGKIEPTIGQLWA